MLEQVSLNLPASSEDIAKLKIGSVVFLNGVVYTAREGVYERVLNGDGEIPPALLQSSNVNFHCSPAAAPDGQGGYTVGGVTGKLQILQVYG